MSPVRWATSAKSASWVIRAGIGIASARSSPGHPRPSQGPRHGGVTLEHLVDVLVPPDREVEGDAQPVQGRVAGAEEAQHRGRLGQAARLVVVLRRLQRDVVATPAGLLEGVGVAADVDQQGGVVERGASLLVEAGQLAEAPGDLALPQHVAHRRPEAEVDAE